ncbi:MAG TPA: hypothetical protein VK644_11975 [Chitinophagaceae bacterium]|nr:hypothetical protein [Chitinophagaceae bacterium]
MKHWIFILTVVGLVVLTSFSRDSAVNCHRTGIKGHVYMVRGNQMPSPDQAPSSPRGMKTTLYVYRLTNINEVSREGVSSFYKNISTELVREIKTDEKGSFSAKLKPGVYSLFIKKGDLYYANLFDGKNNIYPVEVKPGKMEVVDFKANYDAVY